MNEPVVLVVDDEPNVVHLCQRLLERSNYQVLTANDAGHAIEILHTQHVDLLVADIRMPGLNGLQLIGQARSFLPNLAAILMTGYGTLETAISALQKGVDGLVIKPFSGVDFVKNVDRSLAEHRREQEMLRLQTLQPFLEVSQTLFSLRDLGMLADTLVNVTHNILKNDYTALIRRGSDAPFRDGPINPDTGWQIIKSFGELQTSGGLSVEALLDLYLVSPLDEPVMTDLERNSHPAWEHILLDTKQASLLYVPIPANNQQLAILAVRSPRKTNFTQADLETLIVLARQSSIAFENARLYTDLANSLKQIELSQNALLQAERLAAAGRLTASIAHEINNPLQALQNCLDLASRKDLGKEQRQKYLDLAIKELNRLMGTVDQMLSFYRPIARDRQRVNINEIIRMVLELLRPQFDEAHIVVHYQLDHDPILIMAVANQIQQVLINLLINAMEAMSEGGDVWIASRHISEAENRFVEVTIEDSGPGIHGEQLDHLFEPMISSKPNGTGLGLAVSFGIVEAHGGTLKLLPDSQQGACFQIILPEE